MKRLVFLLLLLTAQAFAAPVIPDAPAGQAFGEWLTSFNSGDRVQIDAFRTKYHRKTAVQSTLDNRRETGGYDLLRIESSEPGKIVVLIGARESDLILRGTFEVDPAKPTNHLAGQMEGLPRPAEFAVPRLSQSEVLQALNTRAKDLVAKDRFSGAVLVSDHGKPIFENCYGVADREARTPVSAEMKFRLGSMDKMFTAIAVLQLAAQGKLSLDAPLGQYLTDYPSKEMAKVTLRQLLNHTGGTGDIFGPDFDAHRLSLKTLDDYVALYGARAPEHPGGAADGYDNYGFILLGVVIEKASGQSYYDYVQDNIFRVVGMKDTGFLPEDAHVAGLAPGYMWKDGKYVSNADTLPWRGTSAGGGYSTVADLLKLSNALETNTLLPKAWQDPATSPENHGRWYGYGFETHADDPARYYGHSGGAPGMNADFRIFPDQGIVFIALSNLDGGASTLADFYALRMPLRN